MAVMIPKSGKVRLIGTATALTMFFAYLFHLTVPMSFLAPYYASFQSSLLSGSIEALLWLLVLVCTGTIFYFIPFYFGFLLLYSFGKVALTSVTFLPFLSVLIPAKNEEKTIGNTLNHLFKSDYPKNKMEIIVIASGSTDGTSEICQSFSSEGPIRVLADPLPRKGKPAALNLGLASAKGDVIAVYDADTIVEPQTLRNLVAPLSQAEVSASCGSTVVRNQEENGLTKATALENTYYSGAGLLFEIRERLGQEIDLLGRNYCIRKDILEELGGFEETSLTEDFSLMFKLKEQGRRIAFCPKAFARDLVPSDWKAYSAQRKRWTAGWNVENKKYMATTKNKRKAVLGLINFLIQGHACVFAFLAAIFAVVFWLLGEYFLMTSALLTLFFTIAIMVVAVHKYGNKRYSLLLHFPRYVYIYLYMFRYAAIQPEKGVEWEKTPTS